MANMVSLVGVKVGSRATYQEFLRSDYGDGDFLFCQ